ncbi:MAG: hypothetical protein P9L99_14875 [Candidatus Lernaella stagnicola]|nr:hypothetical protein [Candidatus Lernaella stagnicola]
MSRPRLHPSPLDPKKPKKPSYSVIPNAWILDAPDLPDDVFRIRLVLRRYTTIEERKDDGTYKVDPSWAGTVRLGERTGWARNKVSTTIAQLERADQVHTKRRFGHSAKRYLELPLGGPRDGSNPEGWRWTKLSNKDFIERPDLTDAQFRLTAVLKAGTMRTRGGCRWPVKKLATICGWSTSKVNRVLRSLTTLGMVVTKPGSAPDEPATRKVIPRPTAQTSSCQIPNNRHVKNGSIVVSKSEQSYVSQPEQSSCQNPNNVQLREYNHESQTSTNPTTSASTGGQPPISADLPCGQPSFGNVEETTANCFGKAVRPTGHPAVEASAGPSVGGSSNQGACGSLAGRDILAALAEMTKPTDQSAADDHGSSSTSLEGSSLEAPAALGPPVRHHVIVGAPGLLPSSPCTLQDDQKEVKKDES